MCFAFHSSLSAFRRKTGRALAFLLFAESEILPHSSRTFDGGDFKWPESAAFPIITPTMLGKRPIWNRRLQGVELTRCFVRKRTYGICATLRSPRCLHIAAAYQWNCQLKNFEAQ